MLFDIGPSFAAFIFENYIVGSGLLDFICLFQVRLTIKALSKAFLVLNCCVKILIELKQNYVLSIINFYTGNYFF